MSNNPTTSIPLTDETVDIIAGRTTTFSVGENVASVKVLRGVENGNVTANPDGTLAVVMSDTDYTGPASFIYQVQYDDGRIETSRADLNLVKGVQEAGWGLGEFMLLETDENDRTVVEHGDNHRKVHVSGSENALSKADIAAREGIAESKITADWLKNHPEYGATPEMALDEEMGHILYVTLFATRYKDTPNSNWLLFEKGYEYSRDYSIQFVEGDSALHPVLISSYGSEGEATLTHKFNGWNAGATDDLRNVVVRDLNIQAQPNQAPITILSGENLLLDDINVSGGQITIQSTVPEGIKAFTFRNSSSVDAFREESAPGDGVWDGNLDRIAGIYIAGSHGVLLEGSLYDHAGWGEGYDYNRSEDAPQAPSKFSHNIYIQNNNTDVTLRDNIITRSASVGAQMRSGGFIEDNALIDNNIGLNFQDGVYDENTNSATGNFTLFSDNVITSAGHRTSGTWIGEDGKKNDVQGAVAEGGDYHGQLPTLIDNIVTHLADPNNPTERQEKTITNGAFIAGVNDPSSAFYDSDYYNDTIIYNWNSQKNIAAGNIINPDTNIEGLEKAVLDQTTIQNFTADLLGKETATIDDLANYLRAQANGQLDGVVTADLIIAFFQQGFGLTPELDLQATTQRFVPDDLGDGVRWDNRLNWSEDYTPTEGQNIEFAGNWVYYAGAGTNRVGDLDLGSGGRLTTSAGKLTVTGDLTAGENGGGLDIGNAGQVWIDGYKDYDRLDVDIDGGRFANTGLINGQIDMSISGGQALLSTGTGQFDLTTGSRIEITGDAAKVGFDGSQGQVNVLRLMTGSTLSMIADDTGVSTIREFRSGAYGDTVSNPASGVALGGILELDLSAYAGGNLTLVQADEIIGSFEDVKITGLSSTKNATLITDYDADTVTVKLTSGTGVFSEQTVGAAPSQSNTDQVLWDALNEEYLSRVEYQLRSDGRMGSATYADGKQVSYVTYETANPDDGPAYTHLFDDEGSLSAIKGYLGDGRVNSYHYQDGVRREIVFTDEQDAVDWQYGHTSLAVNGDKVEEYTLYDDLRESNVYYVNGVVSSSIIVDRGTAHSWTSVYQEYDGAGVLAGKATLYDSSLFKIELFVGGKLALRAELDQADEFVWQARAWSYDTAGKTAEYNEFSDEGQMKTTEYATNDPRDSLLDLYDAFQFENGQFVANIDDPFTI